MISIRSSFSQLTCMCRLFSPVYCVCSPARERRVRARSIPNSTIHLEPSEHQFLNVRHRCPSPTLNLVYGARVPESCLSFPYSLKNISTHRQVESKTACMQAACHDGHAPHRLPFRRQPAGSLARIQTLTRLPDHRDSVPSVQTHARLQAHG